MTWEMLPFFPERASSLAGQVDALYLFLVAVSAFFSILIAGLILVFAIRYRRRSDTDRPKPIAGSTALEILWTAVPLGLVMVIFFWGASLYFDLYKPPSAATDIYVIGKQWMWKFQHANGRREINELHVPLGQPVRLTMASEDVIHSLYIPAFRVKKDVVPGTYSALWFDATKTGEFHLFCAEYCGTEHSRMQGRVIVLEPLEYEEWLEGEPGEPVEMVTTRGRELFLENSCNTCHLPQSSVRAPSLHGLFGQPVPLQNGEVAIADEAYIRESILNPQAKTVSGYSPIMPPYQGQLSEEDLLQIILYIKSLVKIDDGVQQ